MCHCWKHIDYNKHREQNECSIYLLYANTQCASKHSNEFTWHTYCSHNSHKFAVLGIPVSVLALVVAEFVDGCCCCCDCCDCCWISIWGSKPNGEFWLISTWTSAFAGTESMTAWIKRATGNWAAMTIINWSKFPFICILHFSFVHAMFTCSDRLWNNFTWISTSCARFRRCRFTVCICRIWRWGVIVSRCGVIIVIGCIIISICDGTAGHMMEHTWYSKSGANKCRLFD